MTKVIYAVKTERDADNDIIQYMVIPSGTVQVNTVCFFGDYAQCEAEVSYREWLYGLYGNSKAVNEYLENNGFDF